MRLLSLLLFDNNLPVREALCFRRLVHYVQHHYLSNRQMSLVELLRQTLPYCDIVTVTLCSAVFPFVSVVLFVYDRKNERVWLNMIAGGFMLPMQNCCSPFRMIFANDDEYIDNNTR